MWDIKYPGQALIDFNCDVLGRFWGYGGTIGLRVAFFRTFSSGASLGDDLQMCFLGFLNL